MKLLVGIDTGGTFTDAAVVDAAGDRVISTAKALTTRGDLSIGVIGALTSALGSAAIDDPSAVALVSVSTTLATNAVVEGHGDDVATVLIGFDDAMVDRTGLAAAFGAMPIVRIAGGHDHAGRELAPLDEGSLVAAARRLAPSSRAFAVASAFATREPDHERRAAVLISSVTGRPVTLSSELSSGLDAPRRALTAALNARLVGRVTDLVAAVRRAMTELGLDCPLMLVKGDGSLALAETVVERPIETVLSGPAASVVGASRLAGRPDVIVSDIGGTTTDIGTARDGRPILVEHGADIGGWRTMVRAVDVRTVGLGGDSLVEVVPGGVAIRPERVVPLAVLAWSWSGVLELLERDLADVRRGGALHGRFVVAVPHARLDGLDDAARMVLRSLGEAPRPLRDAAATARARGTVDRLRRLGVVQLSAFTPTDAAHVLGLQQTWPAEASVLGARLGARLLEMRSASDDDAQLFAGRVFDEVARRSARAVLDTVLGPTDPGSSVLLDAVCSGRSQVGSAEVSVRPSLPLVAVGGPAEIVYREVARRLGAEVVFPPHFEVANAVGAATGAVVRSVRVEVHADSAGWRVHGPDGIERTSDAVAAVERARTLAARTARDAARISGGGEPEVRLTEHERVSVPGRDDPGALLSVAVVADAVGRPVGSPGG